MSEYLKMLHEIEAKKEAFEKHLAAVMDAEVSKFQHENQLAVKDIYVYIQDANTVGAKQYIVSSVSIDLDYRP